MPLSEIPGNAPRVSPDGKWVQAEFTDPDSGEAHYSIISIEGGVLQNALIPSGHQFLCWNSGGTGFTTISREEGQLVLWNVLLSEEAPQRLTEFRAGLEKVTDASWSPDGNSLAVCLQVVDYDVILLRRSVTSGD